MDDNASMGYVCKTCAAPTPMGIGYANFAPGARERSEGSTHSHELPKLDAKDHADRWGK